MSEWPQDTLAYQTPQPYGPAPLLVRLAGIFMIIAAGFDVLHAIGMGIMSFILYRTFSTLPPPAPGGPPPVPPPTTLLLTMYLTPAVLSLLVTGPILFGAIRLLRRSSHAWGWGLAAAILCCCQMWMWIGCCAVIIFPLSAGVYSIVILCLSSVRAYLLNASPDQKPPGYSPPAL